MFFRQENLKLYLNKSLLLFLCAACFAPLLNSCKTNFDIFYSKSLRVPDLYEVSLDDIEVYNECQSYLSLKMKNNKYLQANMSPHSTGNLTLDYQAISKNVQVSQSICDPLYKGTQRPLIIKERAINCFWCPWFWQFSDFVP